MLPFACPKGASTRRSLWDDYPALLRARRRRERWSEEDKQFYHHHRWRSEGHHGEVKTWHGLARAIGRGLAKMRIQAGACRQERAPCRLRFHRCRLRPGKPEAASTQWRAVAD
ncbi:hypothetical protein MESS2_900006 [Mesorhizobium metallidurans STM 2683]|uniref:Transposase n=1 Tax=Mesorhizobium metallidurans STM 2683 TaxID=1297569 RepID=M5FBD0_9HYPH|nr:hypothetical protein MESS2_900006 [Mesorhizobium metallidurans STM 2683]